MQLLLNGIYVVAVFFIFLLLVAFSGYLIAALISASYSIPYVGSNRGKIRKILAEIKPKQGQYLLDIGSGDGRVVFIAAHEFGLDAHGIDLNPLLIAFSRLIKRLTRTKNAHFEQKGADEAPISKADIIYLYLLPELLKPLGKKIQSEANKGTIIISHGFKVPALSKKKFKTLPGKPFPTYYYRM